MTLFNMLNKCGKTKAGGACADRFGLCSLSVEEVMNSKCLARCWFGPDDSKWRSKGFFKTGPHRQPFYPSSCVISSSSECGMMLFIS